MSYLYRYLDTNGDGTGTTNAAVDGSSTDQIFKISDTDGQLTLIRRMIVTVRDNGVFSAEDYGAVSGPLTNGIAVGLFADSDDSLQTDLTGGIPVKGNADWGRLCYDVDLKSWGAGDSFLVVRWTFEKAGQPLEIGSGSSNYFGVKVRDNLSTLVEHYFMIQGTRRA